jgi:hypothetical protein
MDQSVPWQFGSPFERGCKAKTMNCRWEMVEMASLDDDKTNFPVEKRSISSRYQAAYVCELCLQAMRF